MTQKKRAYVGKGLMKPSETKRKCLKCDKKKTMYSNMRICDLCKDETWKYAEALNG